MSISADIVAYDGAVLAAVELSDCCEHRWCDEGAAVRAQARHREKKVARRKLWLCKLPTRNALQRKPQDNELMDVTMPVTRVSSPLSAGRL